MHETPKRLTPKMEVLRELFLKSGNLCAFPDCERLMLNIDGVFIGQLCHIEAAEEGGERFNPQMTNEERRDAKNLMLMCYDHHVVTNDVESYPVARLQQMKRDHESRFSHPDRAILSTLRDYTKNIEPTRAVNLNRLRTVLGWPPLDNEEIEEYIRKLNKYVDKFSRVPVELRNFVGQLAVRVDRMRDLPVVKESATGCPRIRSSDIVGAFHMTEDTLFRLCQQLESYSIGQATTVADEEYDFGHDAVQLRAAEDGWCVWDDIAEFVRLTATSIEAFCVEMDFARLDD